MRYIKDEPVRWDKTKKAHREKEIAERDHQAQQRRIGKQISEIFLNWKRRMAKLVKEKSQDEVHKFLSDAVLDLRNEVEEAAKKYSPEWSQYTMSLLDSKVSQIWAAGVADVNEVTEILPSYANYFTPKQARIRTQKEFEALPWIARVKEKPCFVGFLRHFPQVVALFEDGEPVPVAKVSTEVGLLHYKTLGEYCVEFAKDQRGN